MMTLISLAQARTYIYELIRLLAARRTWIFWGYLLAFAIAELLAAVVNPQISVPLYLLCLMTLVLHASFGSDTAGRELALSLSLVPLIRILTWSFPLKRFPQITWYPILSALLLIACWFIVRQLKLTRNELSLRLSNLPIQLMLAGGGFILGVLASTWLTPSPVLTSYSLSTFVVSAVVLILATGFFEEFLFRGVVQGATLRVFQRAGGLIYASVVCTVLYIGYRSVGYMLFVLGINLLFAYIVYRTGSILGVSLAHGFMNVVLLLIVPYLARNPSEELETMLQLVSWAGLIVSMVALLLIVVRNERRIPQSAPEIDEPGHGVESGADLLS